MSRADVAVVGAGPAGAAVAARLAGTGRRVVVLEQAPAWRWRACGVFSSPAAVAALRRLGLDETTIQAVARPIPAMRVETPAGATFRLTYGDRDALRAPAVGFDRAGLDAALVALARARGADVREGVAVRSVRLAGTPGDPVRLETSGPGGPALVEADVVVGADGPRSVVARAAGVARRAPLGARVGLTFHVPDAEAAPHDARMVVLEDGYVGLAPVPGGRLNVGIVLWGRRLAELRRDGAAAAAARVLEHVGVPFEPCDAVVGAAPLGHRVATSAGPGWRLVGDAAGFLDPFTGEGLHRALVSAELAAGTIDRGAAPADHARAMARRFRAKDAVSLVVQAFLTRPALFEYAARRLAAREQVRETMGLVIGDLVPASRALDPRYVAAFLRP